MFWWLFIGTVISIQYFSCKTDKTDRLDDLAKVQSEIFNKQADSNHIFQNKWKLWSWLWISGTLLEVSDTPMVHGRDWSRRQKQTDNFSRFSSFFHLFNINNHKTLQERKDDRN